MEIWWKTVKNNIVNSVLESIKVFSRSLSKVTTHHVSLKTELALYSRYFFDNETSVFVYIVCMCMCVCVCVQMSTPRNIEYSMYGSFPVPSIAVLGDVQFDHRYCLYSTSEDCKSGGTPAHTQACAPMHTHTHAHTHSYYTYKHSDTSTESSRCPGVEQLS